MCGICGYILRDKTRKVDEELLKKMTQIIAHRGPNSEGYYFEYGIALGHRRLSIIGIGEEGKQPMHYMGRYTIVHNGEIYNYIEIKEQLEQQGYCFHSKTDTEVIMAAYDYWGKECLQYFNGMWAFAIYDSHQETLFCSRDRFAVKPFYYYIDGIKIIFASEIKQILAVQPDLAIANEKRIKHFLYFGIMEYGEETFFENIRQLQGGEYAEYHFKENDWKVKKWYYLNKIKTKESYRREAKKFKEQFLDSVRLRLRADVTVGSCLSGGLDSSAIVCAVSKLREKNNLMEKQMTISSCFKESEEKKYDEQEFIDSVIRETQVNSHKIFFSHKELWEDIDKIIWHMDEPFTTMSICAQWAVFKAAKEKGLKVMLDGQGADEQLAGYSSFYSPAFAELWKKKKFIKLWFEVKWFNKHRAKSEDLSAEIYLLSAIQNLNLTEKIIWKKKINAFAIQYLNRSMKTEIESNRGVYPFSNYDVEPLKLYASDNFEQFTLDMIYVNLRSLLHFEDRNSMAHSIESRVPFLDYRLVETIFSMPSHYKLRNGVTKAVMRRGLKGILTEKVRRRNSKLGFATPEDIWMKKNKERYQKELEEACDNLKGFVNKEAILDWFHFCIKENKKDYISFRIICLSHWIKIFKVTVRGKE